MIITRMKAKEYETEMDGNKRDTIAAVATAPGEAGISIVRISGSDAIAAADCIYRSKTGGQKLADAPSHTIRYGYIEHDSTIIDEVLVSVFRAPRSYTGEDVVEINCHGGGYVTKRVLELAIQAGARPAEPGEFTKRAFLNGRIDLSQAEAVMDVIEAKNEYALKSSMRQLAGGVRKKIVSMREKLIYHIAYIESALDDPEHVDVTGYGEILLPAVADMEKETERLLARSREGRILKDGIRTAIVGRPNAGKSSLLNALAGDEKAIVTDVAGTTRDIVEESIRIHGIHLNLADTAGIRGTDDKVEQIGVDRAKSYARDADLIIYVVDSSTPLDESDEEIVELIRDKKTVVLLNKSDLPQRVAKDDISTRIDAPIFSVSATEEEGIEELKDYVADLFFEGEIAEDGEALLTNLRHQEALSEALASLRLVRESIEGGLPEDFYSIDLMDAYAALGRIIGEEVGDDLVNEIFSKFCMGK